MQRIKEQSFSSFTVNSINQFAYSAAKHAAENPGKVCNPLFIYGGSGVGKTHLLNAIYNQILEVCPHAVVRMLSADEFSLELVESIIANEETKWFSAMTIIDFLLLDNAELFVDKLAIQNKLSELIHALIIRRGQIVITSSAPPKALPSLDISFGLGIAADISSAERPD